MSKNIVKSISSNAVAVNIAMLLIFMLFLLLIAKNPDNQTILISSTAFLVVALTGLSNFTTVHRNAMDAKKTKRCLYIEPQDNCEEFRCRLEDCFQNVLKGKTIDSINIKESARPSAKGYEAFIIYH